MEKVNSKLIFKYLKRLNRKELYNAVIQGEIDVFLSFIEEDEDFELTRKKYTSEFYESYNDAFLEYAYGDWHKAEEMFLEAEVIILFILIF